ncbi:MAG: hypothetical protein K1X64_09570 [Myxococcaceae bacterium]|nr:hypothetical protein [Myxococcaceae bacterium]
MATFGLMSDTQGDLVVFDQAIRLLSAKGARRFFFCGGKYSDLDDWVQWKREQVKSATDYTNAHFLEDVVNFLAEQEQIERPPAFGTAYELARAAEELSRVKDKVVRAPEKGSLQYFDPQVPRKGVDMVGDVLCCVVHDKNDLDKEDMINSVILVHGSSAEPKLVQIGPRYFVTPGKLVGAAKATVATLETGEQGIAFTPYSIEGEALGPAQPIAVGGRHKVLVK